MLVLNLPFKALMFLTLMRPSLVLFLVLWLKLVKDFLKVRCRLALLPFLDRKSGSAGMPRPISYAVFCLKKKIAVHFHLGDEKLKVSLRQLGLRDRIRVVQRGDLRLDDLQRLLGRL